jgi:uncharacterized protein (TIGR02145 family)
MHLPSHNEWLALMNYLGGQDIAGSKMGPETDFNGVYSGGFGNDGHGGFCFGDLNSEANYWSSDLAITNEAWNQSIIKNQQTVSVGCGNTRYGLSTRLVIND